MNKYCQEVNAYGPMVPIAHTINVNTKINKIFQHSYILVTNQSGPYLHMHEQKLTPVGYSVSSEMLLSELVYWVTLDFPHLLQNFLPNHCIIQICQLLQSRFVSLCKVKSSWNTNDDVNQNVTKLLMVIQKGNLEVCFEKWKRCCDKVSRKVHWNEVSAIDLCRGFPMFLLVWQTSYWFDKNIGRKKEKW